MPVSPARPARVAAAAAVVVCVLLGSGLFAGTRTRHRPAPPARDRPDDAVAEGSTGPTALTALSPPLSPLSAPVSALTAPTAAAAASAPSSSAPPPDARAELFRHTRFSGVAFLKLRKVGGTTFAYTLSSCRSKANATHCCETDRVCDFCVKHDSIRLVRNSTAGPFVASAGTLKVVLFRDPLERFLSHFAWYLHPFADLKPPRLPHPPVHPFACTPFVRGSPFLEFAKAPVTSFRRGMPDPHHFCTTLCGYRRKPQRGCWRDVLAKFDVVGIAEDYDRTVVATARALGWDPAVLRYHSMKTAERRPRTEDLPPEFVEWFRGYARCDYDVFEYARARSARLDVSDDDLAAFRAGLPTPAGDCTRTLHPVVPDCKQQGDCLVGLECYPWDHSCENLFWNASVWGRRRP